MKSTMKVRRVLQKLWLSVASVGAILASLPTHATSQQPRSVKVFISVDMEGHHVSVEAQPPLHTNYPVGGKHDGSALVGSLIVGRACVTPVTAPST